MSRFSISLKKVSSVIMTRNALQDRSKHHSVHPLLFDLYRRNMMPPGDWCPPTPFGMTWWIPSPKILPEWFTATIDIMRNHTRRTITRTRVDERENITTHIRLIMLVRGNARTFNKQGFKLRWVCTGRSGQSMTFNWLNLCCNYYS